LRRALENFVEDPLSEELLKGEFQGKDTIIVRVKEVGDRRQLFFEGTVGVPPSESSQAPVVAAGAGGAIAGA
jgi:ATP-dependent Clp protease ATP-binding subunit ClpC